MGIKKLIEKGIAIKGTEEGIMVSRIKRGKKKWRIVGVYISGNLDGTLRKMEQWVEERESGIETLETSPGRRF